MKLSIVYSTHQTQFQAATLSGSLEENLSRIAKLGYHGVELAIRDPNLVDINNLDTILKKSGLKVPAIGTGQAWGEEGLSFTDPDHSIRKKAVDRIVSHIPVAHHFDAVIIIGLIRGTLKPNVTHPQAIQWLVEALQTCCKKAQEFQVRLALEPINRYETSLVNNVTQGLELIAAVEAENFGLLLDTFHMNIEEPDIEESILKCGQRLFHFHVADSNRWYPGAGHLNFQSILSALSAAKYCGFISGEFLPFPNVDEAASKNIEYFTSILPTINAQ